MEESRSAYGEAGGAPREGNGSTALATLEQAAILLLCMGEEPASGVLCRLSRDELLRVARVMSDMSGIKVGAVSATLQQFFNEYREQSGIHGASRSFLRETLCLALGPGIANRVLDQIYGEAIVPKMARLEWVSPSWLADRIVNEHINMQSVFLAFLPSRLASQVLDALPAENRDRVLENIAHLSAVDRDLLRELEELVDHCLENIHTQNAVVDGMQQAADIINRLPNDQQRMVEVLRTHAPDVADEVEARMYDFFVLSRQSAAVLTRISEHIALDRWSIALKGAEPAVSAAIIQVMPRRQVQLLEVMMRRSGPIALSRVQEVRRMIMEQVRELAEAGEFNLQLYPEDVVE